MPLKLLAYLTGNIHTFPQAYGRRFVEAYAEHIVSERLFLESVTYVLLHYILPGLHSDSSAP